MGEWQPGQERPQTQVFQCQRVYSSAPRVEGSVLVKEVETDIWESGPLVLTNVGGKD